MTRGLVETSRHFDGAYRARGLGSREWRLPATGSYNVKRHNTHGIACILGIALVLAGGASTVGRAATEDSNRSTPAPLPDAAAYEAPSWMKARRKEERSQAAWQAEVRAAAARSAAPRSKVRNPYAGGTERFSPGETPSSAHPWVLLPQVDDPGVEALRLQAREGAAERARLKKAAAQGRLRPGLRGRAERQRLEAAQQSRRDDESRLEAAQRSRRDDEARLEAAQQSRRQDEARLEAAQQSRRQDEARLEAAQAERRRQH